MSYMRYNYRNRERDCGGCNKKQSHVEEGGVYYCNNECLEKHRKEVSYKEILNELILTESRCWITRDHCKSLGMRSEGYADIEIVNDLINFRDFLLENEFGELSERIKSDDRDGFMKFVMTRQNIKYKDKEYKFSDLLELFYREEPEMKPRNNENVIKDTLQSLELIQLEMGEKLKTMEQFQAQILDKLTVFADMLDEIQKSSAKVIF